MKNKISKSLLSWLLVFSLILPLMSSVIYTQAADTSGLKDYDSMTMEEIFASEESLTWVVTGDSITHNDKWTAGVNGYGEWLEQYLYEIGRGDDSLVLSGWGGADIRDFLTYEDTPSGQGAKADPGMGLENFITKYNPDVITIKLGMNNRGMTTADFKTYYKKMLDSIYAICAEEYGKIPKIILVSPTPLQSENIYDDNYHVNNADSIKGSTLRLRNAIEDIATEYDLLFCDMRTAFMDAQVELGEDYAATFFRDPSDGLHPNEAGQYCMFKALSKTLGIYDEAMSIYQLEYYDLEYHALYADSTDGVTYTGDYGSEPADADAEEMNKTMPSIEGATPIASVEFDSTTGVINTTGTLGIDIDTETEAIDPLTLEEVKTLEKEFTLIFRAKLGVPSQKNQPVLSFSSEDLDAAGWANAFTLGAQGNGDQLYYQVRQGGSAYVNSGGTFSVGHHTTADDDAWHTIAIVQRETSFEYYVDGAKVGSTNTTQYLKESIGTVFADATTLSAKIGLYSKNNAANYNLKGSFDYWQFYGTALSADNIASISVEHEVDWSYTASQNNVWAVLGGSQMAGYETHVVNRSLMRYLENGMRAQSEIQNYRDIHMYNMATPGYDVADMVTNYDTIVGDRDYQVLLLYPELTDVYESGYVHSADKVTAYKESIQALIDKNSEKIVILWTPIASNNATINGYIDDYADAVREIVNGGAAVLFYDANQFMNDNMEAIPSLVNNWFEDGAYISPLCAVDLARSFYETASELAGTGKAELRKHNLRYTSDEKSFKGKYVNDYIAADVAVNEDTDVVTIDVSAIKAAYSDVSLNIVVLPYKGAGNSNQDVVNLSEVSDVTVDGNVYTFEAPCADLNLAIYGEDTTTGVIYRYKDISLDVNTTNVISEKVKALTEVSLDSLEVVGSPAIEFNKDTTEYTVNLYSYQTYARVKAAAKAGITIKVGEETVDSGAMSNLIKVDDGDTITVTASGEVDGQTVTKTYTLNLVREEYPDIIITEVMTDGYVVSDGQADKYELVEIYNASGKELNLLDYSIGYKKDYPYDKITNANGAEYPYYFTGNDQAFEGNARHTGIKNITKYSMYWGDEYTEPEKIVFPADSTMVIWIKYSAQSDATERDTQGASLTYDTLMETLKEHAGTATLTTDVNGTDTAVVPKESQLVVAEYYTDAATADLVGNRTWNEASNTNWFLDDANPLTTRAWLFILKDEATIPENGTITEEGNNIVTAAKYFRVGDTDKLSSVFSYDTTRGMSLIKNEATYDADLVGTGVTSDVMGYSNLTSFGAIEYWQKPADLDDNKKPTFVNNTIDEVASDKEGIISLELTDNTDLRNISVYVRKSGETEFTKVATKDLTLESSVLNDGVAEDVTSYTYTYSIGVVNGTDAYYVTVEDGNGNVTSVGTEAEPCTIKLMPKIIEEYSVTDAATYVGIKVPECEKAGYLFAGWYADEACMKTPVENLESYENETIYALFVTDDVLSVKAQISANLGDADTENDTTGSIRFITTVDTLNYLKVGFDISYDKDGTGTITKTSVSNKVYQKLYAVNATSGDTLEYYPTVFSELSTYFKACTVTNVPQANYGMDFTVAPFWYTVDGVKVYGVTAVKSINDGINANAEAEIDGTYYVELEQAIEDANADADTTTVIVLNDAEVESQMDITTDIILQSATREDITIYRGSGIAAANMFNVASGATLTIEDKEEKGAFVIDGRKYADADVTDLDSLTTASKSLISNAGTLSVSNVTIQYAKVPDDVNGAAINNAGQLFISNSVMDSNCTGNRGGAIYNGSGASAEVTDTTFTDNEAWQGASIANYYGTLTLIGTEGNLDKAVFDGNISGWNSGGVRTWGGTVDVTNYTFKNNQALAQRAAAMYADGGAQVTVTNSTFVGNSSLKYGGALGASSNGTKMTLIGTNEMAIIENNSVLDTASDGDIGGAICVLDKGAFEISGYTIQNNEAGYNGGAIYAETSAAKLNIKDTVICSNVSGGDGGAIYTKAGTNVISNCSITNNTAVNGGAIYNGTYALDITDSYLKENSATTYGGAIYNGTGALTAIDTYFEGNESAQSGGAIYSTTNNIVVKTDDNPENAVFKGNKVTTNGWSYVGGAIRVKGGNSADSTKVAEVRGYTFTSNSAYCGGAIQIEGSKMDIYDCLFKNNTVVKQGGAVYSAGSSTTRILGTAGNAMASFISNSANTGGAVQNGGSGTLTVSNYTFTGNTAAASSSYNAIYIGLANKAASFVISGCTFNADPNQTIGGVDGAVYTTAEDNPNTFKYTEE